MTIFGEIVSVDALQNQINLPLRFYESDIRRLLHLERRLGGGTFGDVYQKGNRAYKIFRFNSCYTFENEEPGRFLTVSNRGNLERQDYAINELVLSRGGFLNSKGFVLPEKALITHNENELQIFHSQNISIIFKSLLILFLLIIFSDKKLKREDILNDPKLLIGLSGLCFILYFNRTVEMVCKLREHEIDEEGNLLPGKLVGTVIKDGIDKLVVGYSMPLWDTDLHKLLKTKDTPEVRISVVLKIAESLNKKVVHRDIKPENIVIKLDEDGEILDAQLCDNASARILKPGRLLRSEDEYTSSWWAAPEVRGTEETKKYSERSDVYALGSILIPELECRSDKPNDRFRAGLQYACTRSENEPCHNCITSQKLRRDQLYIVSLGYIEEREKR